MRLAVIWVEFRVYPIRFSPVPNKMPKLLPPKAALVFSSAKPRERDYKIADAHGLHLLVRASGSKVWQFRFRSPGTGKESTYTIGGFPLFGVAEARLRRDELIWQRLPHPTYITIKQTIKHFLRMKKTLMEIF